MRDEDQIHMGDTYEANFLPTRCCTGVRYSTGMEGHILVSYHTEEGETIPIPFRYDRL